MTTRSRYPLLILFTTLALAGMASIMPPAPREVVPVGTAPSTSDPIINVSGNAALASVASAGNGTASAPYIIANKRYDMNRPLYPNYEAITISETTAYFAIVNCTINGGGGIRLSQCANAFVMLCNLSTTLPPSIHATGCTNVSIVYNVMRGRQQDQWIDGIFIQSSSNAWIGYNQIFECSGSGIRLTSVTNVNITSNNVTGNDGRGVDALTCSTINVSDNTITSNGNHGIRVADYTSGSWIKGNHVSHNKGCGIHLNQYPENVKNNTLHFNHGGSFNSNLRNEVRYVLYLHNDCRDFTPAWGQIAIFVIAFIVAAVALNATYQNHVKPWEERLLYSDPASTSQGDEP